MRLVSIIDCMHQTACIRLHKLSDEKNNVEDKDTTDAVAVENHSYQVRNLNWS